MAFSARGYDLSYEGLRQKVWGNAVLAPEYNDHDGTRYLCAVLDREFVHNVLGRAVKTVPLVGDTILVRDKLDDSQARVDFRLSSELEKVVERIVIYPVLESTR